MIDQKRKKEIEHKQEHIKLYNLLNLLCQDYVTHTGKMLSDTNLYDLLIWSYDQTLKPSEK